MAKPKWEKWTKEDGLILLAGWARDGLTDEQIAHNMGIARSTLNEWKVKYSVIGDTLKKNKEYVDIQVENALLKRALGYEVEEVKVEIMPDGTKKGIQYKRHIPPDTTAQIFWLKNRRADKWRNKPIEVAIDSIEDDGLIEALGRSLEAKMKDDSDFLPQEEVTNENSGV